MNKLKNFFKDWNLYEKIMLSIAILVITIVGIIFRTDYYALFTALTAVTTTVLLAKGKSFAYLIYIICILLYIVVSYNNRYFGEIIIYVLLILPMCLFSLITWLKHPNKKTNTVEVNNISTKEKIIMIILLIPITLGVYYFLKIFNTNELKASTFTFVCTLYANYLQIRRNNLSFYFYSIEDIALLILWGLPILKGNISLLPLIINSSFNFINDLYGIYNWKQLEKKQKSN